MEAWDHPCDSVVDDAPVQTTSAPCHRRDEELASPLHVNERIYFRGNDMPFLLWIIYPYTMWMGCCSVMLDQNHRPGNDPT